MTVSAGYFVLPEIIARLTFLMEAQKSLAPSSKAIGMFNIIRR